LEKASGDAFGFFLRDSIQGHFLNQIEKNGAAEKGGIQENDRIIAVNGVNVENEKHAKVNV